MLLKSKMVQCWALKAVKLSSFDFGNHHVASCSRFRGASATLRPLWVSLLGSSVTSAAATAAAAGAAAAAIDEHKIVIVKVVGI